jgi:hypothetical protein
MPGSATYNKRRSLAPVSPENGSVTVAAVAVRKSLRRITAPTILGIGSSFDKLRTNGVERISAMQG